MIDTIGNCFLCEEKSLHIAGREDTKVMQCINCGYTTSTKFKGIKADNEDFQKLGEDMKNWAKEENGYIWIPSIITLPIGMLYPINDGVVDGIGEVGDSTKSVMKWAFASMVEIPEEERKNYPNPSVPGKFYERKIDTDNPKIWNKFLDAFSYINEIMKSASE